MTFDEFGQERVGAGGVVRRVRQPQDVLVLANRKVGPLPKFWKLPLQLLQEVLPPSLIRLEGHSEALDRLATPGFQLLFVGLLEHFLLSGQAAEKLSRPAVRFTFRHP